MVRRRNPNGRNRRNRYRIIMITRSPHPIPLPGIDGANPLGFLAALGTWRTVERLYPETRMHWETKAGHWSPVLCLNDALGEDDLVKQLFSKLQEGLSNRLFHLNKDLKIPAEIFRQFSREAIDATNFHLADWISAIGSDVHKDKYGNIEGTLFDLMNAGKQYFLQNIRFLVENTSVDDIINTLFQKWAYQNMRGGMRWDLAEDRRYALRWKDPQADTTESQWGANRLAIEALPLLQTAPASRCLQTTCFLSQGKKNTFFTWPIWSCDITISTCRSLLGLIGGSENIDPDELSKMGVVAVFRSQRIWKGNPPNDYSNFCPAVPIG